LSSAEGKTIIYSSHDLDISLGYCDHLLLLEGNGRTRFYESAAEISQLKPATLFSTD
jgi:ABC-type cobalamin/Fe3+-siderophores transport system ATPase subunit